MREEVERTNKGGEEIEKRRRRLSKKTLSTIFFSLDCSFFPFHYAFASHLARNRAAPLLESALLATAQLAVAEMAWRARTERCNSAKDDPPRTHVDEVKKKKKKQTISKFVIINTSTHPALPPPSHGRGRAFVSERRRASVLVALTERAARNGHGGRSSGHGFESLFF